MQWSTQTPTEPGWYAFRYHPPHRPGTPEETHYTFTLLVLEIWQGKLTLRAHSDDDYTYDLAECGRGEWKGPLDFEQL